MRTFRKTAAPVVLALVALAAIAFAPAVAKADTPQNYKWVHQESGTTTTITNVCAIDSKTVWAVGSHGTILRYDGSKWATDPQSGTVTQDDLFGITALDSQHVWAVGWNDAIIFYDGNSWSRQVAAGPTDLFGVYALDANHVWAVGTAGTIAFFDGASWQRQEGASTDLGSVYAASWNDAWIVGNYGYMFHFDGTSWTRVESGVSNDLSCVKGLDSTHIWAAGQDGMVLFYDGNTWQVQSSGYGFYVMLRGLSIADQNHAWAFGDAGLALFYDGASWTSYDIGAGTSSHLWGASFLGVSDIWVAGNDGMILYGNAPSITACSPTGAVQGQSIDMHIEGSSTHFQQGLSYTQFNGTGIDAASTTVTDATHATARVNIAPDCSPGTYGVNTFTADEIPNWLFDCFQVYKAPPGPPAIDKTSVTSGPPGATVVISGKNFGEVQGSTVVSFNGTAADIDEWSDTSITCEVPDGATSGPMDVEAVWGTSNPVSFVISGAAFFFAEGTCRPNFDTYFCIQNPGAAAADVKVTYYRGDGTTDVQTLSVPPTSRATISAKDRLGVRDDAAHDFSTSVECTNGQGIVCERPMYFNYQGKWTGGSDAVGTLAPTDTYYFAEGTCRPGFDTYFCIANPNDAVVNVKLTYMKGDGRTVEQSVKMLPLSRATVRPADVLGTGNDAAHDFSAKVVAADGKNFVCERSMYFSYKGVWPGGHDVIGAASPGTRFYFAEGTSRPGFDAYLCIQNPGVSAASVRITYLTGDGRTVTQSISVPGGTRTTVHPADRLGTGNDAAHDFSTIVECTNGQGVVCERPMYFKYGGALTGGSCVVGSGDPDPTFSFAEGCARPGFVTYLTLLNPDIAKAEVKLTCMAGDGSKKEQAVVVPPHSRVTVDASALFGTGNDPAHDFSMKVTSTNGIDIVAERPMYFMYHGAWPGGHDVVGY